jgi:hypothetical protein
MEKYARSDADHKKMVEMRQMMRQNYQPGWHNPNHYNPRPNPQYIHPVQPQQEDESQSIQPFITPPPTQQSTTFDQPSHRGGRSNRARGRGRGRGCGQGPPHQNNNNPNEPNKFFCHFHRRDSDHTTNYCPEKKKTLERMEDEKKGEKIVSHTA